MLDINDGVSFCREVELEGIQGGNRNGHVARGETQTRRPLLMLQIYVEAWKNVGGGGVHDDHRSHRPQPAGIVS